MKDKVYVNIAMSRSDMLDLFSKLFEQLSKEADFGQILLYLIDKNDMYLEPKVLLSYIDEREWSDTDKSKILKILFGDKISDNGRIISNVYNILSYC